MELKFGQKPVQEWGLREEKLRQVPSPRVRSWEARAEIPFLPPPQPCLLPRFPPLLLTGGREGLASSSPFPRGKGPGEKRGGLILVQKERVPWGLHHPPERWGKQPQPVSRAESCSLPQEGFPGVGNKKGAEMTQHLWKGTVQVLRGDKVGTLQPHNTGG